MWAALLLVVTCSSAMSESSTSSHKEIEMVKNESMEDCTEGFRSQKLKWCTSLPHIFYYSEFRHMVPFRAREEGQGILDSIVFLYCKEEKKI